MQGEITRKGKIIWCIRGRCTAKDTPHQRSSSHSRATRPWSELGGGGGGAGGYVIENELISIISSAVTEAYFMFEYNKV